MPQFNLHTPKTQSDMKAMRMNRVKLPIGLIGDNNRFAYGFDGDSYYVTEGVFSHLVTRLSLSLDEASNLFYALDFIDASEPCNKIVSSTIKNARKKKLSGEDLFWFFVDCVQ